MKFLRSTIVVLLVEILMINSIGVALFAAQALADNSSSVPTPAGCTLQDPNDPSVIPDPTTLGDSDPGDVSAGNTAVAINLPMVEQNDPLFNKTTFDQNVQSFATADNGHFDASINTWIFCNNEDLSELVSGISLNDNEGLYLSTLEDPASRYQLSITDKYAVEGEPCRLYLSDGTCDETLDPVLDSSGKPVIGDDGQPEMKPRYFDDIFTSGASKNHWDAPKVDARILKTLVYLVTPVDEGGAGHEFVGVSRITQTGNSSNEISDNTVEESASQLSSHSYDILHPEHPTYVAQAMDISEIDTLRITTRTTEHHRVGNDTVTYNYQSMPIKVSWQTDSGAAAQPVVPNNAYNGALSSFAGSLTSLLGSMNIDTSKLNLNNLNINNLGNLSSLIGQSSLASLFNAPSGSLHGWDFSSTQNALGRSYIEDQLGLPAGSLSQGTTADDVISNIGEATVENDFNLPLGSLKGSTASTIWQNVGLRYLEDTLDIEPGTLSAGQYSQADLLAKIGQGKLEKALDLAPGSMSNANWSAVVKNSKIRSLFTASNAGQVDDELGLGFQASNGSNKDSYGFTAADYTNPTLTLIQAGTPAAFAKYKQLVGSRAISSGIGTFTTGTGTGQTGGAETENFAADILSAFGVSNTGKSFLGQTAPSGTDFLTNGLAQTSFSVGTNLNGDTTTQALIDSGAYTSGELQSLVASANNAVNNSSFTSDAATNPGVALGTLNSVLLNWQYPLQTKLDHVNEELSATSQGASDAVSTPTLLTAQKALSTALGSVRQYTDGLLTTIDLQNQSGQSAALNFPGTLYASNPDGTFNPNQKIIAADPLTTLLSGNLTTPEMQAIGKIVIAQKIAPDRLTQHLLAGALQEDTSPAFGKYTSFGVDATAWTAKGLDANDFERIFSKDLASQAFNRIGHVALLQTAWNMPGLQQSTTSGSVGNAAVDVAQNNINSVSQGYSFFANDYSNLLGMAKSLLPSLTPTSGFDPTSLKNLLSSIVSGNQSPSIAAIQANAAGLEVGLNGTTNASSSAKSVIAQINPLVEELIAGHPLSLNQTPSTPTVASTSSATSNTNADGCLSLPNLRTLFQGNGNFARFADQAGECRLDNALDLPTGSMANWSSSGDTSLNGLALAIGSALSQDNSLGLDANGQLTQGREIISSTTTSSLVGSLTGVAGVSLTSTDIFNLISGNSTPVLQKLGGSVLDTYLNWNPGTAQQLINPQCTDPTTGLTASCSQTQATDVRLATMATMGLKELGNTLNFPSTLNLSGSGDFLTNYGTAAISQILGINPNSFSGSFSNVRSANQNNLDGLLSGLSWLPTSGLSTVQDAQRLLAGYANGTQNTGNSSALSATQSASTELTNDLDSYYNLTLDSMSSPNSGIYSTTPATQQATATTLATKEQGLLKDASSIFSNLLQNSSLDSSTRSALSLSVAQINSQNPSSSTWMQGEVSALTRNMLNYNSRISGLTGQFGLAPNAFQQFIIGSVSGNDLARTQATKVLGGTLANDALTTALANTPFANLPATFTALTKSGSCPNGTTVGAFLTGASSNGCDMSISIISLSSLATSKNPGDILTRGVLYDDLLGRSFGMNIEQSLDVQPGTIRAIVMQPWEAKDIAIDQGIRAIGSQLLQLNKPDMNSGTGQQLFDSFRRSLMAGFCPLDPLTGNLSPENVSLAASKNTMCTLDFNSGRALTALKGSLAQVLTNQLNKSGFGHALALADMAITMAGGLDSIYYIGAQQMVNNIDQSLSSDPSANQFMVSFSDFRNAFGGQFSSSSDLSQASTSQQAQFIRNYYSNSDIDISAFAPGQNLSTLSNLPDQQIITLFTNDPSLPASSKSTLLSEQATTGSSLLASQAKQNAQIRMQFQSYDAAAYKIDKNIPPGFSYAMFKGTDTDRAHYLGLYLANTLNLSKDLFGSNSGITNTMLVNLSQYALTCFNGNPSGCNQSLVTPNSLNLLDTWFTSHASSVLGIDLPAGTVQGIFAWGSTGFKASTFDTTTKFQVGGGVYSPLGTVLRNWAMSKVFGWADKALGFDPGTVYQLYTAGAQIVNAFQAVQTAEAAAPVLNSAGSVLGDPELGDEAVKSAQTQLVAAEAAGVSTVINIAFKSEIADAERALGLVPGTGALAVSILVALAMGAPVSPVTIGLFVVANLFGVYHVVTDVAASPSGYYPFVGTYGSTVSTDPKTPLEHIDTSPDQGKFNVQDPQAYHAGIENAAQVKVNAVLRDLLSMPSRWQASTGEDGNHMWIAQIYTAREEDANAVDDLVSQPAPWEVKGSYGYGTVNTRANLRYDTATNSWIADPNPDYRSGVFYCLANGSGNGALGAAAASNSTASPTASASAAPTTSSSSTTNQNTCAFTDHIHVRF